MGAWPVIGAGMALVVVGIFFLVRGRAADAAVASVWKLNIQGPTSLVLVIVGVAMLFVVWYLDEDHANDLKEPPTEAPVTSLALVEFEEVEGEGTPFTYGDDVTLDGLYDRCFESDMDACDELYQTSPSGSEYEFFGATCGGVYDETNWPEFCAVGPPDTSEF